MNQYLSDQTFPSKWCENVKKKNDNKTLQLRGLHNMINPTYEYPFKHLVTAVFNPESHIACIRQV